MDRNLLDLNKKLLSLIQNFVDDIGSIDEFTHKKSFLLFAFAKSHRTLNSILILCEAGYGQDAFILVRALFELVVTMEYVFTKDTESRLNQFDEYDWVLREKLRKNLKAMKSPLAKKLLADFQEETLNEIEVHSQKVSKRKIWSKKDLLQMAIDVGLGDFYYTVYYLGSQFTHSTTRSAIEYMKVEDGKFELIISPSTSYVDQSLIVSFMCFLSILKQLDSEFNLGLKDSISDIEKDAPKSTKEHK